MSTVDDPSQPPTGDSRWKTLGKALRARREQLGLSQHELTARGGPSAATVRYAENGQGGPYRSLTIVAFERALEWEPGSFLRILNGGEAQDTPTPENVLPLVAAAGIDLTAVLERINAQLDKISQVTDVVGGKAVRVPDDVWALLAEIANERDCTVSEALAQCILEYAEHHRVQS